MSEVKTFKEQRKHSIGGTDVAALCGVNKYKTPYNVYEEKIEGKVVEENEAMILGKCLESGIAKRFKKATNLPIFDPIEDIELLKAHINDDSIEYLITSFEDDERVLILRKGIAHGSIDYFTVDQDGEPAIVECKLMSNNIVNSKEEFITSYPHYYMQVQWYMYITGFKKAYISTAQFKFKAYYDWFFIEFNQEIIDKALVKVEEFWNKYLKTGIKPPPQNPEELNKYINFETKDEEFVADDILFQKYNDLLELREKIKHLKENEKDLDNALRMSFVDKEVLKSQDGFVMATYKSHIQNYFDKKKLQEDEPDIYNKYVTPKPQRKFLIK